MKRRKYHFNIVKDDEYEYVQEAYPIIIFNGLFLPLGAIFIDRCASTIFFEDIDDELSRWFWRFTICVGVNCSDDSRRIVRYANTLKSLMISNEEKVKEIVLENYDENEASDVYWWWLDTLDIMIDSATKTTTCEWRGVSNKKMN